MECPRLRLRSPAPAAPERVAAGECSQRLGGIPTKEGVVNDAACAAAFPAGTVVPIPPDGPDNDQTLGAQKIVFYQEATSSGTCDDESNLPISTAKFLTAAYGAYCHSDRGPICPVNLVLGEGEQLVCPVDEVPGFDNVLRVCPVDEGHQHTGTQFATGVLLAGTVSPNGIVSGGVAVLSPPNLSVKCQTNIDNDGIHKVWIPNQERLAQADVDIGGGTDLGKAPKLHAEKPPVLTGGVAPVKAVPNVLLNGVLTLELTYKKCDLAKEIFAQLESRSPEQLQRHAVLDRKYQSGDGRTRRLSWRHRFQERIHGQDQRRQEVKQPWALAHPAPRKGCRGCRALDNTAPGQVRRCL